MDEEWTVATCSDAFKYKQQYTTAGPASQRNPLADDLAMVSAECTQQYAHSAGF